MLVGLGVTAVLMAVIFAVQAVSSDSRPSDARSSVEENGITPTSGAPEVGVIPFSSTDERASLGRESELTACTAKITAINTAVTPRPTSMRRRTYTSRGRGVERGDVSFSDSLMYSHPRLLVVTDLSDQYIGGYESVFSTNLALPSMR
jgi:hypothetical protein